MIVITKLSNYWIKLSYDNKEEFESLTKNLTTTNTYLTRDWRTKKLLPKTKTVKEFSKCGRMAIKVGAGLLETCLRICKKNNLEVSCDKKVYYRDPYPLLDKWRDVFSSHPRGEEYTNIQIDTFESLIRRAGGIAQLGTGIGKTEILLSLADTLSSNGHKVIIFAYSNSVVSEIISRGEKYGLSVTRNDWSNNINIINVTGFARSNVFDSDECKKWLSEVSVRIVDECHNNPTSQQKVDQRLINLDRSYGFSATADKFDGSNLRVNTLTDLNDHQARVLASLGNIIIDRSVIVSTVVHKITTDISRIEDDDVFESHHEMTKRCMNSPRLIEILDYIISRTEGIVYFPVVSIKDGKSLYDSMTFLGVPAALWHSGTIYCNGEHLEVPDVNILKEKARAGEFKILFTTSVAYEGSDIPNITTCVPMIGSSYKMTLQPIGRAARGDLLHIWLVYDLSNRLVMKQMVARSQTIKRTYNIIRTVDHGECR